MSCYSTLLSNCPEYLEVLKNVRNGFCPSGATGLPPVPKAHLVHSLCEDTSRRAIVILPDEGAATKFADDLNHFAGRGKKALLLPARDYSFNTKQGQSREFERARLKTLCRVIDGEYSAVVCSAEAALQFTIPPEELKKRILVLKPGSEISSEQLTNALLAAGFTRADEVEGTGQFASRGGIFDFFPPDADEPVRIELWGDTVDTIASFDVSTQRRTDLLPLCRIVPAEEILFAGQSDLKEKILAFEESLSGKGSKKAKEVLDEDIRQIDSGVKLASVDKFLHLAYPEPASVFDYCQDDLLFVCESGNVKNKAENAEKMMLNEMRSLFESGVLTKGLEGFTLTSSDLFSLYASRKAYYLDSFPRGSFDTPVRALTAFNVLQAPMWNGILATLLGDLRSALSKGVRCIVDAGTEKAARSLAEALETEEIDAIAFSVLPAEFPKKTVSVVSGGISGGFSYPSEKFLLLTYGRGEPSQKKRRAAFKAADAIQSLEELSRGDYVVHSVHGIGIFEGIQKMDVSGLVKDYIKIKYDKGDVLYVPVTQLDLVSKYIGPREESRKLKLSRLGGKEWERAKSRVRSSAKNMAKQLIELYARRMKTDGFAFSPDIDMQNDFERRFEYDETDDQLRTVEEIKLDMEQPHPMDRLLCGDVGFGKTEVALRAAFKCIADGKQCALLVPTTILALQHYNTILKRFEGFPVNCEMLSRFRSAKEQAKIIRTLKRGSVDMVVGTHRLISKDVQFKDLGLIIVDEEQRFGVGQKEKLKELYPTVDCLTLSATPIPRTMNMAMSGIRDMSVIEEAPSDRFPVQTYVLEHDWGILEEAMKKELRRGGQIYYLHNHVESIDRAAATIKQLIPEARVGVAHGKMAEENLSDIWKSLLEGDTDILVCTTIIETGVDVPNANTLIIEDADHLGLAQLHQIRGRVGRSARRGFAYLTYRRDKMLTEIAEKRLSAIREYTEFGSGFKIAMRDLEIRGAGNLLGAEQHGHMEAVGYDMYMKLLAEAVSEEKGEIPEKTQKECLIDIQIDAHIPETYIASLPQRLAIYKRIADIRSDDDASDVFDELIDRFGDPPPSVEGLIKISLLRNTAADAGVYEIGQKGESLLLYSQMIDMNKVALLAKYMRGRIMVSAGNKPYIAVKKQPGQDSIAVLTEALTLMKSENKKEIENDDVHL